MYNRVSNMMEKRENVARKEMNQSQNNRVQNDQKTKSVIENEETNNDIPKALKRNIKIENSEEVSLDKTTEILNQINQYLDEEKKKLK